MPLGGAKDEGERRLAGHGEQAEPPAPTTEAFGRAADQNQIHSMLSKQEAVEFEPALRSRPCSWRRPWLQEQDVSRYRERGAGVGGRVG